MLRPILLILVLMAVMFALHPASHADKPVGPAPNATGEIQVRFHDGGTMRMSFAGDYLPVTTKHGKLKIAVADIRKLELATRIPENVQTEIQRAIRELGDEQFKVREAATRKLQGYRERAYPDLLEALKSPDQEVRRRAKELVDELREAVPAEKLRIRPQDIIHTIDSVIACRIEANVIPVESAQFGKLDLKLADASSIVFVGNATITELKLDGKYALQTEVWLDTNLDCLAGSQLTVEAEGEIDMYATGGYQGQYVGSPRGRKAWPGNTGLPHEPGTLLGKIGKNGTPFVIGGRFEGSIREEGRLYLRAAGNPYSVQTAGEYTIRISGGIPAR